VNQPCRVVDLQDFKRVAVIGTSCSGKTTFARHLALILNCNHVELDALNWLPEWTQRPENEFKAFVETAVGEDRWVVDGNYSRVREVVWSRATTVIWLDYPFPVVLYRALSRTFRRSIQKEILYSGNRESLRKAFFSSDSILLWVLKTYRRHRREYSKLLRDRQNLNRNALVLRSSQEAEEFLAQINK
jgi:adenylate kinase family enzyme